MPGGPPDQTFYFSSAAPQAAGASSAPQAAGLSSAPQAAGFSSVPHALPQADDACFGSAHSAMFFSAILFPPYDLQKYLVGFMIMGDLLLRKYAPFYYIVTFL